MTRSFHLAGAALLSLAALTATAQAQTLRVGTFLSAQGVWHEPLAHLIETVNSMDLGVTLELVADPSAINPFQLGDALSSGVVDMAYLSGAFYTTLVPEADALKLLNRPVAELRANGAMDILDEVHRERMNAHFLGKLGDGVDYFVYTTEPVEGRDLSGLDLRGQPAYRPFLQASNANMVQMPGSEIYSAMESGVVDGYVWPLWGIQDLGLLEVTRYRLEPGFYNAEIAVLVNGGTWDGLTDAQRDGITAAMVETEEWFQTYRDEIDASQRQIQVDAGIQTTELSEEEGALWRQTADESGWAVIEQNSPGFPARIREIGSVGE
jgi:TRAP-type transport system periplasmic protein